MLLLTEITETSKLRILDIIIHAAYCTSCMIAYNEILKKSIDEMDFSVETRTDLLNLNNEIAKTVKHINALHEKN